MSNNTSTIVHMREYLSQLTQGTAHAGHAACTAETEQQFKELATPLVDRLRVLVATIPPEQAKHGMSIEWFRTRLRGKYCRHAMAGDVAQALRELGWIRRRGWRESEDGFRARWFPGPPYKDAA
jgi:hypothetical protein